MNDELSAYIDPVITDGQNDIDAQLKKYRKWWAGLLIVIVFSFIFGYLLFNFNQSKVKGRILSNGDVMQPSSLEPDNVNCDKSGDGCQSKISTPSQSGDEHAKIAKKKID